MKRRPPARTGDEVEALAGAWNADGAAIANHEDWQLRIAGAHPGETVSARIDAVSEGAPVLFAHRTKTLTPGPVTRRKSPCAIHVRCGGCPIITAGAGQFRAKVESAATRLPDTMTSVLVDEAGWITSPRGLGYRHKAVLLPSWGRSGLKLGGYARRTHDVVDHADCSVLAPALLRARGALHERLEAVLGSGRGYARPPGAGGPDYALRSLVLRANRQGEVLATAVGWSDATRTWVEPALSDFVGDVLAGLQFQVCDDPGDRVYGSGPTERLAGAGRLREQVGDVELTLRPLAFFQVNPDVLELIVPALAEELPDSGTLVDLYCGGGALGLSLAANRPGLRLVGVERDAGALASAEKDARRLEVEATWLQGKPEDHAAALPSAPDAVVIDPPRAGLSASALKVVAGLDCSVLTYLSCHGPSLARDAERLAAAGWVPSSLRPADMLPQTPHVEWLATFRRG